MLHKTFQLYLHGKLIKGTHAESAKEALATFAIPPEDIAIASSSEQKVVFDYQGDVYVLQDVGYYQEVTTMANYYIETASGNKVVNKFEDALSAVYRTQGLQIAELVLRGTDAEGDYLFDQENGWNMDEMTEQELSSLRATAKSLGLYPRIVLSSQEVNHYGL